MKHFNGKESEKQIRLKEPNRGTQHKKLMKKTPLRWFECFIVK